MFSEMNTTIKHDWTISTRIYLFVLFYEIICGEVLHNIGNFVPNSETSVLSGFTLSLLLLIQSNNHAAVTMASRVLIWIMCHRSLHKDSDIYSMFGNYFTERDCIESEKERPKERAVGDSALSLEWLTHQFFNFNDLLSVFLIDFFLLNSNAMSASYESVSVFVDSMLKVNFKI